jgi:hypothetical protein
MHPLRLGLLRERRLAYFGTASLPTWPGVPPGFDDLTSHATPFLQRIEDTNPALAS